MPLSTSYTVVLSLIHQHTTSNLLTGLNHQPHASSTNTKCLMKKYTNFDFNYFIDYFFFIEKYLYFHSIKWNTSKSVWMTGYDFCVSAMASFRLLNSCYSYGLLVQVFQLASLLTVSKPLWRIRLSEVSHVMTHSGHADSFLRSAFEVPAPP